MDVEDAPLSEDGTNRLNRSERRRRKSANQQVQWRKVFDANPMVDGMPPSFLLYLLNEKDVFVRHGKLMTASLWLQSQMVALVCLYDDPQLRELAKVDHGQHFPSKLHQATVTRLEDLSSGSLRREFLERFESALSEELKEDLERVLLGRDALAHGYVSLVRQILGDKTIVWSPRPNRRKEEVVDRIAGPRPENTFFTVSLSDLAFEEEIARICRVMDFIASTVKQWGIIYPVFA